MANQIRIAQHFLVLATLLFLVHPTHQQGKINYYLISLSNADLNSIKFDVLFFT